MFCPLNYVVTGSGIVMAKSMTNWTWQSTDLLTVCCPQHILLKWNHCSRITGTPMPQTIACSRAVTIPRQCVREKD